jgi:hypothetical protein
MQDGNSLTYEITQPRTKRAYSTPQLTEYGNLRQLTQAIGQHGNADNGNPPNHKSQP